MWASGFLYFWITVLLQIRWRLIIITTRTYTINVFIYILLYLPTIIYIYIYISTIEVWISHIVHLVFGIHSLHMFNGALPPAAHLGPCMRLAVRQPPPLPLLLLLLVAALWRLCCCCCCCCVSRASVLLSTYTHIYIICFVACDCYPSWGLANTMWSI